MLLFISNSRKGCSSKNSLLFCKTFVFVVHSGQTQNLTANLQGSSHGAAVTVSQGKQAFLGVVWVKSLSVVNICCD